MQYFLAMVFGCASRESGVKFFTPSSMSINFLHLRWLDCDFAGVDDESIEICVQLGNWRRRERDKRAGRRLLLKRGLMTECAHRRKITGYGAADFERRRSAVFAERLTTSWLCKQVLLQWFNPYHRNLHLYGRLVLV
jgi:hypothetical protein